MTRSNARRARDAAANREFQAAKAPHCEPRCVECGHLATKLVGWSDIYRPRPDRPDLMGKQFWVCDCGAFVGCHGHSTKALGYPAGPATQAARKAAHASFDRLWQAKMRREGCSKAVARGAGYLWLARQLGIDEAVCHIAMMDAALASRVVDVCRLDRVAA